MRFIQQCVFIATALVVGLAGVGAAQKPVTAGETATATATVQAIDAVSRLVTLKYTDGSVDTIYAGPEIKRFNELKVGNVVTFRYYESAVVAVTKPGQAEPPVSGDPTVTRGTGARPSATVAQQLKAAVTVQAIDATVPSITVRTASGNALSYKVANKKNIEGLKVGDQIVITYTQALMIDVQPAKQ